MLRRAVLFVLLAALAPAAPATAGGSAVTYQANAAHDGNAGAAGLKPPLRRAWSLPVDGLPSYALITGGRVFTTVALRDRDSPGASELLALSARSGRVLWRRNLGRQFAVGIAYDAGRLFVSDDPAEGTGGISAYDPGSGRQIWRVETASSGDPPVAYGGGVYIRVGENADWIAAFRQSDGADLWRFVPGNGTDGSFAVTSDAVYATLPCGDTLRLRRADGAVVWRTEHPCAGGGGSTAVFAGGRVYGRAAYETPPAQTFDAATGALLNRWPATYPPAFRGSLGLFADARRANETLSFGHVLTAREVPSGRARWRFRGDGYLDTAPLIAGATAYVGSGSGRLYGLSLRSGRPVWRTKLDVPVRSSFEVGTVGGLAAADGLLVVPAYRRIVAFRD